jgi:hypothetical protein
VCGLAKASSFASLPEAVRVLFVFFPQIKPHDLQMCLLREGKKSKKNLIKDGLAGWRGVGGFFNFFIAVMVNRKSQSVKSK